MGNEAERLEQDERLEHERNLCVSDSVSDDTIHRAWEHLFGNNAVKRIECRGSKKIIHLCPSFIENLDEDEEEDILDMYCDIYQYDKVSVWLYGPSDWWIYGRIGVNGESEHRENCFDVSFA